VGEDKNLHDVRLVDIVCDIDVLVHSSPCTNISIAGKNEGAVKGSGTQSALIYESIRIINKLKPKMIVYENVTNLLSGKHKAVFLDYLNSLESLGYNNTYQILNACDFGLAQSRNRIFVVSMLGGEFHWPYHAVKHSIIADIVESPINVPDKYYLKDKYITTYVINTFKYDSEAIMRVGTILGINGHDILKRVYSQLGLSPTLTTGGGGNTIPKILAMRGRPKNGKNIQMLEPRKDDLSNTLTTAIKDNLLADGISIRKLTPLEYFRLQGFSDNDYKLLRQHRFSDSQLYKLIGNSIAVPVLEYIFKELYKEYVN